MRVLWYTNIPMPDVNSYFKKKALGTGGWMGGLLELLKQRKDLDIGVVVASPSYPDSQFEVDGITYFVIHQKGNRIRRSFFPVDCDSRYLNRCVEIVKSYNPDVIHIHGTERFYGEMISKNLVSVPIVVSLQGIMMACCEWYRCFGKLSVSEIVKSSFLDSIKGNGIIWGWRLSKMGAIREKKILETGKYFFGRTTWDRAYVSYYNNNAKYFKANEAIRKPFWDLSWDLDKCKRHRIIFTNARHPRKGTEVLLSAIEKLKELYPDIELVLIGEIGSGGYGRIIRQKIAKLENNVKIMGQLSGENVALELQKSHIFVSPSYIDNSPNSLAEAQIVGTPVIASYTGGIASFVKDGENGLLFSAGDVPELVQKIILLFENDLFVKKISQNAKYLSRRRHDEKKIINEYVAAYKEMSEIP